VIATNLWSFHARRWLVLLLITIVLQWAAVALTPLYKGASHGPFVVVLLITAVPVLWSLVLLTIRRDTTERMIAYGSFAVSVMALLLLNSSVLG